MQKMVEREKWLVQRELVVLVRVLAAAEVAMDWS